MKTIAVANRKGGCSKSTTSLHLAIGLAQKGYKVLVIDTDQQSSLSIALGCEITNINEITIATHLEDLLNDYKIDAFEGIIKHEENIDIMPSNLDLADIELRLQEGGIRMNVFKQYISQLNDEYDYVICDTSPSLSLITLSILSCVDSVLIPIQLEYLVIKGLNELLKTINQLKRKLNPKLEVLGIVITMANMNTKISKEMHNEILNDCSGQLKVFDTIVPKSVKVVESSFKGISVYEHSGECKASIAYQNLVEEILAV